MPGHPPATRPARRRNVLVGGLALGAAVAVGLLLVLADRGRDDGGEVAAQGDPTAAEARRLSEGEGDVGRAAPNGAAGLEAVEPLLDSGPVSAAPPIDAARSAAPVADAVTFRGRVVDETGLPVAGATVLCIPNAPTQRSRGIQFFFGRGDTSRLARTRTDGQGRFELSDRSVPFGRRAFGPGAADLLLDGAPVRSLAFEDDQAPFPTLAILSDLHAPTAHLCLGLGSGDYDAGDITVEPGGRLTGRVVDAAGSPVAGASVVPQRKKTERRPTTSEPEGSAMALAYGALSGVTSAEGRFDVGPLWNGSATLEVTEANHQRFVSVPHDVTRGASRDVGDLVLLDGLPIAGQVVDGEGRPVAGARVYTGEYWSENVPPDTVVDSAMHEVSDFARETPQVTGEDGRFTAGSLDAKPHRLVVDAPHFEVRRLLNLQPPVADLRIELEPAATLRLTVVDEATGAPLPDAIVRAERRRGQEFTKEMEARLPVAGAAATGQQGTFLIERLGRIRTDVVVSAPGHVPAALALEGVTPGTALTRVQPLARGRSIAGRVLSSDGSAIAGAFVTAAAASRGPAPASESAPSLGARVEQQLVGLGYIGAGGVAASPQPPVFAEPDIGQPANVALVLASPPEALSGTDGAYVLSGVAPGDWTVRATLPGLQPSERLVTLASDADLEDIDLSMLAGGTVFGLVADDEGRPEPGAFVLVSTANQTSAPAEARFTYTDLNGEFEVVGLRPGAWDVGRAPRGPTKSVEVAAGDRVRVDLVNELAGFVSGRVLAGGAPVQGSQVTARRTPDEAAASPDRSPGARVRKTSSNAHGEFELKLPSGEWRLQAHGGEPALGLSEIESIVVGPRDKRRVDLVFSGAAVSGRVTDLQDGAPIAGAGAKLTASQPTESDFIWSVEPYGQAPDEHWPTTDAQGRFVIPHVPAGEYRLSVTHPEYGPAVLDPLVLGGGGGQVAGAAAEDTAGELSIELQRLSGIRVTVKSASGAAVATGTSLQAVRTSDGWETSAALSSGQLKFMRLAPGEYDVRVLDAREAVLASRPVTLADGERQSLDFVLQP